MKKGVNKMEIQNLVEDFILNDAELRHNIELPGYMGKTTHVFIFQDKEANTYYWVTASYPTGFCEGRIYNIKAKLDRTRGNRLSFVKIIKPGDKSKSEQPDAEDVLLGLSSY